MVFEKYIREIEAIDTEYDYYDFDSPVAEVLFKRFCDRHGVKYQAVNLYSASQDKEIPHLRVSFGEFSEAVADIREDLDGDIPATITEKFMKKVM